MTQPRAVFFDLDGTVADTELLWKEAEEALFAIAGRTCEPRDLLQLVGVDLERGAELLRRMTGLDWSNNRINEFLVARVAEGLSDGVPWREGAVALLETFRARGIACWLVTSSPRELAEIVVTELPPGTFSGFVAAEDVTHAKPHPEPYRLAARLAHCEPQECLAIEDSPSGVESALMAGAVTVAVPNMVPISPRPKLSRIASLTDLTPSLVSQLMEGERHDSL